MRNNRLTFFLFFLMISFSLLSFASDYGLQASRLMKEKNYIDARVFFEKELLQNSEDQDLWLNYAECLRNLKFSQRAMVAGWKGVELDTELADAWITLANILVDAQQWDSAIQMYKKAGKQMTDKTQETENLLAVGTSQLALRHFTEALSTFTNIKAIAPNHAQVFAGMGLANIALGKNEEGKQLLNQSRLIASKNADDLSFSYISNIINQYEKNGQLPLPNLSGQSSQALPARFLTQPAKGTAITIDVMVTRNFYLNETKMLSVRTPENWDEIIMQNDPDFIFRLTFLASTPDRFVLTLSPLNELINTKDMEELVKENAHDRLSESKETNIPVFNIKNKSLQGYGYNIIDKNAHQQSGDDTLFPYLSEGLFSYNSVTYHYSILAKHHPKGLLKIMADLF